MELQLLINNNFIKKQINKLINNYIYKKINMSVDTQVENLSVKTYEDGNIHINFNGSITVPNAIIGKLLESALM